MTSAPLARPLEARSTMNASPSPGLADSYPAAITSEIPSEYEFPSFESRAPPSYTLREGEWGNQGTLTHALSQARPVAPPSETETVPGSAGLSAAFDAFNSLGESSEIPTKDMSSMHSVTPEGMATKFDEELTAWLNATKDWQ
jgi:hypothetical protein